MYKSNMLKTLPLFKITIANDEEGIDKMSLVSAPAVESDFLKFSKQEQIRLSVDDDQHIVLGVALRCDYPIYRISPSGYEYYVMFDADTIRQIYEKFMKNPNKVNLEHSVDTEGVYLIQSFIKNSEAGINPVGFEDIENGSWFTAYKVDNTDVWNKIKTGELNGFSIEGLFTLLDTDIDIEQEFKKDNEPDEMESLIDELLR